VQDGKRPRFQLPKIGSTVQPLQPAGGPPEKPKPASAPEPEPCAELKKAKIHLKGWQEPAVQRAHMDLIVHIWHKWVPLFDTDITEDIAKQCFAMFKADPKSKAGPVRVMKLLSARIFANYVDLN